MDEDEDELLFGLDKLFVEHEELTKEELQETIFEPNNAKDELSSCSLDYLDKKDVLQDLSSGDESCFVFCDYVGVVVDNKTGQETWETKLPNRRQSLIISTSH